MSTGGPGLSRPSRTGGLSLSAVFGALTLLLVAGALVVRAYPWLLSLLWDCTFKQLTGLPCLSCGLTRVLLHFANGELLAAFALAPLPASVLTLSLLAGLWYVVALVRGAPSPDEVLGRWLGFRAVRWGAVLGALALWGYAIVRSLATGAP